MLLESEPRAVQLAGGPVPHGDDELRREEDADLSELDLLPLVHVASAPQDGELDVAVVLLELRTQVEGLRVLDRELVQSEPATNLVELLRRGLGQAQPNEAVPSAPRDRLLE